jgi:phosphohistidine swiveling domain-containing protein
LAVNNEYLQAVWIMVMSKILNFKHSEAANQQLAGGKGVNLARLAQAGFNVPPGFIVPAQAYLDFAGRPALQGPLSSCIEGLSSGQRTDYSGLAEEIGALIMANPMPAALVDDIRASYADLGSNLYVAVRSSGTAEDLADASFAGQHDTYLDVCGVDKIADAVKRCWASLWTERAIAYRQKKGFDHRIVSIAVVVQKMVASDVAGVMYTANPVTAATDETVINATWGLGESLVQGNVTPDQYVVQMPENTLIEQVLGDKALEIVRNQESGAGVVTRDVVQTLRDRYCLDIDQVKSLARLGEQVQSYYGGFPQDIEWAIEEGDLYLLQSRPITGVEFSWDADIDAVYTQKAPADTIWTRAFGDALASGVVSPLTYSTRFPIFNGRNLRRIWETFGFKDMADMRAFKYWKGELYYNVEFERRFVERMVPPPLRPMLLDFIPPAMHQQVIDAPFDQAQFMGILMRWHMLDNDSIPTNAARTVEAWRRRTDYEGLSIAELQALEDEPLIDYCNRMSDIFGEWNDLMWIPIPITFRLLMSGLKWLLANWYAEGDPQSAFANLVAGVTQRTDTQLESSDMHALVDKIRQSALLTRTLEESEGADFFDRLNQGEEGRQFLALYQTWLQKWGHRGHADRDYMYLRREEDPAIDVRAFRLLLNGKGAEHAERAEHTLAVRRMETFEAVRANLAAGHDGALRAKIFEFVFSLTHEYLVMRDNERARPTDLLTYARKKGYVEIGRRLYDRGLLDERRDFHFLSEQELFQLFRNRIENPDLLKAKIRGRARNCDRMLRKEADMPMHLQRNRPVNLDNVQEESEEGVFCGEPTSPGTMTATARVISSHSDIGRVSNGEILVTHSTDPGWNPVFGVISGVVVETGGLLSHASCLAREYGFPAVHLPNATRIIPDGARITVDGSTGRVTLL